MENTGEDLAKLKVTIEADTSPLKKELDKSRQEVKKSTDAIKQETDKIKNPFQNLASDKILGPIRNMTQKIKKSLSSVLEKHFCHPA